jgi:hypothetical protein
MAYDFGSALDGVCDTILTFDFNCFASKDTVSLKPFLVVHNVEVDFAMIVRQKAVFGCLKAAHAQDFLLVVLIDGLDQHMSPVEYRTILMYPLMIPYIIPY